MSAPRNAPPRLPRALFIAAFAIAGARVGKLKRQALPTLTPYRQDRRDRSIAHIARHLGRPIIAAGRAQEAFESRATCHAAPPRPSPPRLDPIAAAIIASRAVAAAIGQPEAQQSEDAAWIEVRRDAATPHVRIYWRGEFIQGERMGRVFQSVGGRERVVAGQGETVGSSRTLNMERFSEGVAAARASLQAVGVGLSAFIEIKRVNTPAFKGAVATLGLARAKPAWARTIERQAGMVR